jgi:hypothetical protein
MSTFVLRREYALQLPNSFVDVECEEMEYIQGGLIGLPDAVESWIWGVIGGVVGNIIYAGKLPGWMVKAAVTAVAWIKYTLIGVKAAIKANPFAAGVIAGGAMVGIAWYIKDNFL